MKLSQAGAEIWVPDGVSEAAALERVTHLAIAAHPDDVEIMALEGILACFGRSDQWFCAVIVTGWRRQPLRGVPYAAYTDRQMQSVRQAEQKKAAFVGEYAAVALLNHPSSAVKSSANPGPQSDLKALLAATRPQIVYTHNLADKHDTHVAVALRTIAAIREFPADERPSKLYGCEVWRDLDWLVDSDKMVFRLGERENIAAALVGVFDSQIAGGKRYDLGTLGRRRAHATYYQSHTVDLAQGLNFAVDLTALIENETLRRSGRSMGGASFDALPTT